MLAPLLAFSDADWVARLPATLAPALVALALHAALRRWWGCERGTADLAAVAVLLLPMNVWNVLVTTDTPLVLLSAGSLLAFARAAQLGAARWFLAAGVLLGLAFLSKYLAVMLGLAYLAWAAAARRWGAFALVFAGALPFALLNLWSNYNACWSNLMFNAVVRHQDDGGWSLATPALYAAALAYCAAPLFWHAWRGRAELARTWSRPAERALLLAWLVPLAVFAALSPVKRIGLHWLLSFLPALVASLALGLGRERLAACARALAGFALLHVLVIGVAAALPLEAWRGSAYLHSRLVLMARTGEVLAALGSLRERYALAADSYSIAAHLAYRSRRDVPVFGAGSSHARQDDIQTDWRGYDGRDLLVLRREAPPLADYRPYFRELELRTIEVRGAIFHAVLGRGFDYAAYRDAVLRRVRERYYRIPAWLPAGRCYFLERYFPA